jgi:hypothetical protein
MIAKSSSLQRYIEVHRASFRGVRADISDRWIARIESRGLHTLGEDGAKIYLKHYGRNISEDKVIGLALKAELEGCQDMAMGFWKKAYEIANAAQNGGSGMASSSARTRKSQQHTSGAKAGSIKVLFLVSNPGGTAPLKFAPELRDIGQAIRLTEHGNRFDVIQELAVRVTDLQDILLRHQPDIVHFTGHGTVSSELILEDKSGDCHAVPPQALKSLFLLLKTDIRCVVLSACHSERQAEAIAEHIDCVIGMSQSVLDSTARAFSIAFYRALGYGRSVETSFELGRNEVALLGLSGEDIPVLKALRGNANETILI